MDNQIKFYQDKLAYEMDPADLFDALENQDNVVVIDARKPEGFAAEHIPGAINIPHRTMTQDTTQSLDRGATYVVYCDGIGCNASTRGALNLTRLGFRVRELIGGLDWWKRDGYATEGNEASQRGRKLSCYC